MVAYTDRCFMPTIWMHSDVERNVDFGGSRLSSGTVLIMEGCQQQAPSIDNGDDKSVFLRKR